MGKDPPQRQRAYREYVCSDRDKEEQEIREKMTKGVIGAAGFREQMGKKVIEIKRPEGVGQRRDQGVRSLILMFRKYQKARPDPIIVVEPRGQVFNLDV